MVPVNSKGHLTKYRGVTFDGLTSHQDDHQCEFPAHTCTCCLVTMKSIEAQSIEARITRFVGRRKNCVLDFLCEEINYCDKCINFFTLERRIADVQKSRNMIAAEAKVDFSDAAGFRRPIKFNCISCSRPVELPLRGPLRANLPAPRGVRTKRSKGPYLSYEMDQVRIVVSACSFVWLVVD